MVIKSFNFFKDKTSNFKKSNCHNLSGFSTELRRFFKMNYYSEYLPLLKVIICSKIIFPTESSNLLLFHRLGHFKIISVTIGKFN